MVMLSEEKFIEEMLDKGIKLYRSKRQLAFAIGLNNVQTMNKWESRGKVPGDWKPKIASLLGIDWLAEETAAVRDTASSYDSQPGLDLHKVTFALGAMQAGLDNDEFLTIPPEILASIFAKYYKASELYDGELEEMTQKRAKTIREIP